LGEVGNEFDQYDEPDDSVQRPDLELKIREPFVMFDSDMRRSEVGRLKIKLKYDGAVRDKEADWVKLKQEIRWCDRNGKNWSTIMIKKTFDDSDKGQICLGEVFEAEILEISMEPLQHYKKSHWLKLEGLMLTCLIIILY
jgi:hypothetical protein